MVAFPEWSNGCILGEKQRLPSWRRAKVASLDLFVKEQKFFQERRNCCRTGTEQSLLSPRGTRVPLGEEQWLLAWKEPLLLR